MCGIAGSLEEGPADVSALRRSAEAMAFALRHRGPDDGGVWVDGNAGIALAHRRLSILDLSPAGRQPMTSPSGRFRIVFNGEIYNFAALRQELTAQGTQFLSGTDTEVLLAGIERWGTERTLKRAVGMFAFALWDGQLRRLILARDRLGEKPLYYGWLKRRLVFGSELVALKAHPTWEGVIQTNAVAAHMRYGYVPAPHSIYQGIYKLPPGTWLTLTAATAHGFSPVPECQGASVTPQRYWSLPQGSTPGFEGSTEPTQTVVTQMLENHLRSAIRDQLVADVPVGAFLSGGIDSATVVALMQMESSRPVRTFTIGFNDDDFDEAPHAASIARHLGTEHTELYVDEEAVLRTVPDLTAVYDEPFADASMVPTLIICRLARRYVTVCLTGDGGDELFGGYNRYRWVAAARSATGWLPTPLRRFSAAVMSSVPPGWIDRIMEGGRGSSGPARPTSAGHRLRKFALLLGGRTRSEVYERAVAYWTESPVTAPGVSALSLMADDVFDSARDFMDQMMLWDTLVYLPDDNLVKVDRAAMSVGLEARVPLLDHRVVEFASRIPLPYKISHGAGKHLLRNVLYRHVPRKLMERPKMGFSVPIGRWLCGPLRDWAEMLLDKRRLRAEGFFDADLVDRTWHDHLSGRINHQAQLWSVLMFQAWHDAQNASPHAGTPDNVANL